MITNSLSLSFNKALALTAMIAVLMWSTGFASWIHPAEAVNLTTVSDTLSDSDLNVSADHTIVFTTPTAVADDNSSTTLTFDLAFNISTSTALIDFSDIDVSTTGPLTLAADCTGSEHLGVSVNATLGQISFQHCSGDGGNFTAGGTTTIQIGQNATGGVANAQIINPTTAQSYPITINTYDSTYTGIDSGATRVAIIDDVLVTAAVDTTLTFIVYGLDAGLTPNGSATASTISTTPTTLPFGTLVVGTPTVLAQSLSVATNARNGYTVTLNQNQNLTSSTGADIDRFQDDTPPGSPAAWAAPNGTLGNENEYGHMGITTEDSTLVGGDDFGSDLWAGDFVNNPREVLYHDGPADGITANQGSTTVGFQAEIMAFQEAGTDYQAVITYVATPVF